MATVAEVEALLTARDKLSAALSKAQQNTKSETGKISGHFEKMQAKTKAVGAKMQSVGKGMTLGVTAPIIAGAISAVNALGEIERLSAQTDAAIASTGGAANVSREDIVGMADSLERLTSIEAEVIQEGQNMLLTFTKVRNEVGEGNDIFDQATKAALDFSVATGTDMTAASLLMGKALNDPIKGLTALSKSGVGFTEDQKEMIKSMVAAGDTMGAQKIILGELETQYGGSGEALGNTMVGKIAKAKNAFGAMTETLATALIPTIEKVTAAIQKAADWFNNMSPAGQKVVGTIIAIVAAVGPLLIIGGKLVSSVTTIGTAFGLMGTKAVAGNAAVVASNNAASTSSIKTAATHVAAAAKQVGAWIAMGAKATVAGIKIAAAWVLSLGPIGLIVAAVIAVVALIIANWDKILAFLKRAWEWIKGAAASVGNFLKDEFKKAVDFLVGLFLNFTPLGLIIKHFDKIKEVATGVKDWIVDKFTAVIDFFKELPGKITNAVGGWLDGLKTGFKKAINWIIGKWNDFKIQIQLPSILGGGKISIETPNIPKFHEGGMFRAPTPGGEGLAVLKDRETVIPAGGSSGSSVINVNIHVAGSVVSEGQLVDMIYQGLVRKQRRTGALGFT